ncbi:MAG: 23S rRNA (adenine(2503)-C(2))-methyltransferase RlmN [Candidatus Gastranaerophilales bacterium]|nr:23S rRNA (adenine(2503)-C(2))-methyltransferase RlmN [Candidatus Gastranaerophilales bacterium]
MEKILLTGKSQEEILALTQKMGATPYRAKQVYQWIYLKSANTFEEMTNLPKDFRAQLDEKFTLSSMSVKDKQVSRDGTIKYLFELNDGNFTESVLMRFDNRANLTACISSQVGCPMGCDFCATGKLGFKRNLKTEEIIQQIHLIQNDTNLKITNIVFMGQGEPLLNFNNVINAMTIFNKDYQVGSRRMTISTCGIIPQINKLADLNTQSTLAISLHSSNHQTRARIMPVEMKYPIDDLIKTLKSYTQKTGRRVTIEYTLIKGVNDSIDDAKELALLLTNLKSNVNLIVYNANEFCKYQKPDKKDVMKFKYILEASGKKVTVRLERGGDIDAACGQLSAKTNSPKK